MYNLSPGMCYFVQVTRMSVNTEIICEPDIKLEALEPTESDGDATAADVGTNQDSQEIKDQGKKSVTTKGIYSCNLCEYIGRCRSSLYCHKRSKHKGIRYSCDQCMYAATTLGNLKQHKDAKHTGIRYPCDQCEYTATQQGHLKTHKESRHEGIRYPCDQCNYTATNRGHLKEHKDNIHNPKQTSKSKHNSKRIYMKKLDRLKQKLIHQTDPGSDIKASKYGIAVFSCDQCEFVALNPFNLKKHKQSNHEPKLQDRDCDLETKEEVLDDKLDIIKTECEDPTF